MAEEVLKKLQDQLNCAICLDTYTDPKQLQCHHVFCRQCLVKLVVRDQQGQLTLTCPNCRQITLVPANGVAGLQSAFNINKFLEIQKSITEVKESLPNTNSDAAYNAGESTPVKCCDDHSEELKLYCESCDTLICYKCAIRDGKHFSHDYQDLSKAFEHYKQEIASSLEPMEKQLITIKTALTQLDICCDRLTNQQSAVEADIHSTFRRIHEILDQRKTDLISQLHHITQGKLKDLAIQRDQIETTLAQLSSCLDFVKESLETSCEREVLLMKKTIVKQANELTSTFNHDTLRPCVEEDLVFLAPIGDIMAAIKNFGTATSSDTIDPAKCPLTGEGVREAEVGKASTIILSATNFKGQPLKLKTEKTNCQLVSEIAGTMTQCHVERRGPSQCEISYHSNTKGRHFLHISIDGQHIRGSPFSVIVKSPQQKLGTPIKTMAVNSETRLWGIALSQNQEIVVTEFDNAHVSIFSPAGEKLRSFGGHGSGLRRLGKPRGVAVDGEGNILVVDSLNKKVQKFTPKGRLLAAMTDTGRDDPSQPKFQHPRSIAFNSAANKVYVVDKTHLIQVLNSDLTLSAAFGKHGTARGHFKQPRGIACDSSGNVYVADSENHRIQVFTAKGKFLRMFGKHGEGKGELNLPLGLAIEDSSRLVYVCDNNNHRICVFTLEGKYVQSFGGGGKGPGEFVLPTSIAVDESGVVYVCDCSNCRLQLF